MVKFEPSAAQTSLGVSAGNFPTPDLEELFLKPSKLVLTILSTVVLVAPIGCGGEATPPAPKTDGPTSAAAPSENTGAPGKPVSKAKLDLQ